MPINRVWAPHIDFSQLRRELELPAEFPPDAMREAREAATGVTLPAVDRTDIPFVTVDPATSRDLDQAMELTRRSAGGYRVRYAIADVASYVRPGGALEAETWVRGQTIYFPDGKVPLHPQVLSEGAVSLLPDVDRAAILWTIDLDADGEIVAIALERARVRSRAKLDYVGLQADVDAGTAPESIALLPELGTLLARRAADRGAVNLPLPEQEVEQNGDGWQLVLRAPLAVEEHNAQISLLTGMAAATLMLRGGIGLLRTMPAARPEAVTKLRAAAASLDVPWPPDASVGAVVASVDPASPRGAAFLNQAAELLRGAGYTAFDNETPDETGHGGVGAPYAHVTAPLRRLADRYATEVCLALHEGREVPQWAREALPRLPKCMATTDRVASAADRGAVGLAEAVLLAHRVGETFEAGVLDVDEDRTKAGQDATAKPGGQPATATEPPAAAKPNGRDKPNNRRPRGGKVAIDEPAVQARCLGDLPLGDRIQVRLTQADPATREVLFERI
ncbi:RNB domain-containing ribonuclease [Actinoplanes auranticolor]|uniref:Ribonuclease R n=1 Tax=Actinoplanes auranticolor TaxID=47988 RepID=A0A919SLX2_9ACTN|nr:RNB domain-containing ribonuclease [Actinoplanes auranticolor]GIM74031.1 ribonuclease R [Actinoplanes auranticolor]